MTSDSREIREFKTNIRKKGGLSDNWNIMFMFKR